VAGNYYPNLSPLENEPPMKALFLGTLAASQAMPIIEFITADIRPKSSITTNRYRRLRRSPMRMYC
jgi:hypothetical protein